MPSLQTFIIFSFLNIYLLFVFFFVFFMKLLRTICSKHIWIYTYQLIVINKTNKVEQNYETETYLKNSLEKLLLRTW